LGQTDRAAILGDGRDIFFWQDRWNGECTLMSHLFKFSVNPTVTVYEVVRSGGQVLQFSRSLSGILLIEFNELSILVRNIILSLTRDRFFWRMSPSGKFFSHEVYDWLMFRGMTNSSADVWWYLPIPLKIKNFMWLVVQNKILTKDNLIKRGWCGSELCTMFSNQETVVHLFVTC
jgi:zinc-binding in reverse transcriptase